MQLGLAMMSKSLAAVFTILPLMPLLAHAQTTDPRSAPIGQQPAPTAKPEGGPTAKPEGPEAPEAKGSDSDKKPWQSALPAAAPSEPTCTELPTGDPGLDAALASLTITSDGQAKPIGALRLEGLTTLPEAQLWEHLGGLPEDMDAATAAVVVRHLVNLGLFSSVTLTVELPSEAPPTLVIRVLEHPRVVRVAFEGLSELRPETLLEQLLATPARPERGKGEKAKRPFEGFEHEPRDPEEKKVVAKIRRAIEAFKDDAVDTSLCQGPPPPRQWLARSEGKVVFPGIVWRGIGPGLERVLKHLYDRGYELATLAAELEPEGVLRVRVSEGDIARVVIRGVAERIEPEVRALLGLESGQPFVRGELDPSVRRLQAALPFLAKDQAQRPTRARPEVVEVPATNGNARYVTRARPTTSRQRFYVLEGNELVLYFKARPLDVAVGVTEIIRHTPVTGFAPGLDVVARLWDPKNRMHVTLDVGGNINTHRARELPVTPSFEDARWRFDWRAGASFQIPDVRVAEVGARGYSAVDTSDRWRMHPVDSYLYSLFFNRPGHEYFHRTGVTGFLTFHVAERATAGVEYRRDEYESLRSVGGLFTVFNDDETPPPTPAVTEGTMASVLFRIEWSTHPTAAHRLGSPFRDPERAIVPRRGEAWWTAFHTMNTLEVANPEFGGDEAFRYVRLVSDSATFLRVARDHGLKLRVRAAGRLSDDPLPLQKQEALGGWSALRGYGFKEYRGGSFSFLGTAEYRVEAIGLFFDAGSLRTDGSFGTLKTSVGTTLNLGDDARLDLAWRTDDEADWAPEVRLLFARTF